MQEHMSNKRFRATEVITDRRCNRSLPVPLLIWRKSILRLRKGNVDQMGFFDPPRSILDFDLFSTQVGWGKGVGRVEKQKESKSGRTF